MSTPLNLEQLRKQAKDLVRAGKAAGRPVKLADAQLELARRHGFASWPRLKSYVERLGAEQPFHTDIEYYEGRAYGIATVSGVTTPRPAATSPSATAFRPGLACAGTSQAMREGDGAADALHACLPRRRGGRPRRLAGLLDAHPELVLARGTNGNDLLGMADSLDVSRLMLDRGADPNRGNDYGWTKLHQAGYSNWPELARMMLAAGGRTDLSARGDGGTPLIAALFWGHRDVAPCSGVSRGTCAWPQGSGWST